MVDFRRILEGGKSNYTRVLTKISMGKKGVFKATYSFINDAFPMIEREGVSAEDTDTIISTMIGGAIAGVNEVYKEYDFKEKNRKPKEIDLDDEKSPFPVPDQIIDKVIKVAKEVIQEEVGDLLAKLNISDATVNSVLNTDSAKNMISYLVGLTSSFYAQNSLAIEEADERKEVLPTVRMDDKRFDMSAFQDEFKMEKWFNNLRK